MRATVSGESLRANRAYVREDARRVSISSCDRLSGPERSCATIAGSAISAGTAKQVSAGTLIASGRRLRSRISPRLGLTSTIRLC